MRVPVPAYIARICGKGKSSFVHSANLCRGGVRIRVRDRGRVRDVIDRYAINY